MFTKRRDTPSSARLDLHGIRPIDLYDAWLFAAAEASLGLGAWQAAGRAAKADTFATYRAALDREEHAARVLALRLTP